MHTFIIVIICKENCAYYMSDCYLFICSFMSMVRTVMFISTSIHKHKFLTHTLA